MEIETGKVEQLIKRFDLSFNNLSTEGRLSLLIHACDYVEGDRSNQSDKNPTRRLLAYILANKLYDFGYVLSLRSDYTTQSIEMSFSRALQVARYGYELNDGRLQKFIDPLISIGEQKGDSDLVAKLKGEISSLTN